MFIGCNLTHWKARNSIQFLDRDMRLSIELWHKRQVNWSEKSIFFQSLGLKCYSYAIICDNQQCCILLLILFLWTYQVHWSWLSLCTWEASKEGDWNWLCKNLKINLETDYQSLGGSRVKYIWPEGSVISINKWHYKLLAIIDQFFLFFYFS